MSQRDVERALGRLLTDEQFRRDFGRDPVQACAAAGFDLSLLELDALGSLPVSALPCIADSIDERIRRLDPPFDSKESRS